MKFFKYAAWLTALIAAGGLTYAFLPPSLDVQAANVEMTNSDDVCEAPSDEGDDGDGTVVVNPMATCDYAPQFPRNYDAEITTFVDCLTDAIDAHAEYAAERMGAGDIRFAINREDEDDLPDLRVRENDPVLQTTTITLVQDTQMQLRIRAFAENPSTGFVNVWINETPDDDPAPSVQVDTGPLNTIQEVMEELYDELIREGFNAELLGGPFPDLIVRRDPSGFPITYVKFNVKDDALVFSDLMLEPLQAKSPL